MSTYANFQEMLAETKSEGDRACALTLAANIDNRLRDLLAAFFVGIKSGSDLVMYLI